MLNSSAQGPSQHSQPLLNSLNAEVEARNASIASLRTQIANARSRRCVNPEQPKPSTPARSVSPNGASAEAHLWQVHAADHRELPLDGITIEALQQLAADARFDDDVLLEFANCSRSPRTISFTTEQACQHIFKADGMPPEWSDIVSPVPGTPYSSHQYVNNLTDVVQDTAPAGTRSVVDLLRETNPAAIGKSNRFISHYWQMAFRVVVRSAARQVELERTAGVDERIYLWLDVISLDQHCASEFAKGFSTTFMDGIEQIGHIYLITEPWCCPSVLSRCWCVWELYCCHVKEAKLSICLSQEQEKIFLQALESQGPKAITFILAFVSSAGAKATKRADMDKIMGKIQETVGIAGLDTIVIRLLKESLVCRAAEGLDAPCDFHVALRNRLAAKGIDPDMRWRGIRAEIIGGLYMELGQLEQAEPLMVEALQHRLASSGDSHPITLRAAGNLGLLRMAQGKLEQAELLLTDVIGKKISTKAAARRSSQPAAPGSYPERAFTQEARAGAEAARRSAAEQAAKQEAASERAARMAAEERAAAELAAQCATAKAEAKAREQETRQAVAAGAATHLVHLLEGSKYWTASGALALVPGPPVPGPGGNFDRYFSVDYSNGGREQNVKCKRDLGLLYHEQGKLEQAETWLRAALKICQSGEQKHGSMGWKIEGWSILSQLGLLYRDLALESEASSAQYRRKAQTLLVDVLQATRASTCLGARNPLTIAALTNLGLLYKDLGLRFVNKPKLEEAESMLLEALDASQTVLGERHPNTLKLTGIVVDLLREVGKLRQAKSVLGDAVATATEVLGSQHRITMAITVEAARLQHTQYDGEAEGQAILNSTVEQMAEVLGAGHPQTRQYMSVLSGLSHANGSPNDPQIYACPLQRML